jgi:hypothetical protein
MNFQQFKSMEISKVLSRCNLPQPSSPQQSQMRQQKIEDIKDIVEIVCDVLTDYEILKQQENNQH